MDDPHLLAKYRFSRHVDCDQDQQRCAECRVELVGTRTLPDLPLIEQRLHRHPVDSELCACRKVSMMSERGRKLVCDMNRVNKQHTIQYCIEVDCQVICVLEEG